MRKLLVVTVVAIVLGLVSLFVLQQGAPASVGQWRIVGHTIKAGGFSQAVVAANGALYILRGHQSDDPLYFWRCKFSNQGVNCLSEPLTGLPRAQSRAPGVFQNGTALTWDGERFFYALAGGFYKSTGRRDFWRYDTRSRSWKALADTPGDQGPGDALAFVRLGDEAYVYALIGAATKRRSKAFNSFLRYNVAADRWENDLPALWACTDDGAALAWDGGRSLYALQGSDCQDQATHNFARFDLQDWRWEELPSIPEPVNDGGSLVWDGARYLYAIVGEGRGAYRFDTQKSSWEELADLPCPVGYYTGNRLAVIEGKVYAWQGSPSTWECGGSALMRLDL